MTRSAPRRSGFRRARAARKGPRLPLVLVVDDGPHILAALARLLREEPYEMWTGEVSVLVVDYRMPGI